MNPTDDELKRIEALIDSTQYHLASESLLRLITETNLSHTQKLEYDILKATVSNKIGRFTESILSVESLTSIPEILHSPVKEISLLSLQVDNYFRLGQMEKCLDLINTGKGKIDQHADFSQQDRIKHTAILVNIEAGIFWQSGSSKKALELLLDLYEIQKDTATPDELADTLEHIGVLYNETGDHTKALQYLDEALAIVLLLQHNPRLALLYNNFGWVHRLLGNMALALDYFEKSMKLEVQSGNEYRLAVVINNIGKLYYQQGKFEQASQYLVRSLQIGRKIGNPFELSTFLFDLILNNIELNKQDQVNLYLNEFQKVCLNNDNIRIMQRYQLAHALFLKSSDELRLKFQAQEIFKEIATGPVLEHELTQLALLNQCDLLLSELLITRKLEILDEISPLLDKLIYVADNQHSYFMLAKAFLLKAKLAIIGMDIDQARIYLSSAQKYAMDHQLDFVAIQISEEHDKLLDQQDVWESLPDKSISIEERIQISGVNFQLLRKIREKTNDMEPQKTEIPVAFILMNDCGPMIFTEKFESNFDYNDQLFGGVLSALHTYCEELFSRSFDRAKFGKYTIILYSKSPILFAYVFIGASYEAQKRLSSFIDKLGKNQNLWAQIEASVDANNVLKGEILQEFLQMFYECFPESKF
ncbi:MAG: tetratricopeptide repeat protein [Promethearchaeota archaeon]|nr:MAG: tetratricopeptide repeat protein [Candidatus Lokiarchaeota archaeon]